MQTQFKRQSHVLPTSTEALLLLCGHDGRPAGEMSLQAGLRDICSICRRRPHLMQCGGPFCIKKVGVCILQMSQKLS